MADLSLLALTWMWGTTFLVVNRILVSTSPGVFLILRFTIATCIGAAIWLARRDRATPGLWRDGFRLGSAMFAGFAFQSEALRLTTPARSAFLTGMSVLFVPLLERLVYRRAVKPAAWVGVVLAVVGMGLMSGASVEAGVRVGDLLALASAVPFALQIIWTAERSPRHPLAPLTTIQLGVCFVGAALMLAFETPRLAATPAFALALGYMGVVMTTGAFFVQNWAQRHITPTRAALIFALEPVFAALVSSLVGGERLGIELICGGALIVAGVVVSELARA